MNPESKDEIDILMGTDGKFSQMLMHRKEIDTHDEADTLKECRLEQEHRGVQMS